MYVLIQSMYCFSWLAAYWLVGEDPPKGVFPRRFFTSCTQNNAIKMKVLIMRVMKKPSWAALPWGACIGTYIHRGPSMWNSFLNRTVPRNNLMSIWPNQFEMHLLEKTIWDLQPLMKISENIWRNVSRIKSSQITIRWEPPSPKLDPEVCMTSVFSPLHAEEAELWGKGQKWRWGQLGDASTAVQNGLTLFVAISHMGQQAG